VKRILTILALAAALLAAAAVPAWAGSPHFVDDKVTLTQTGNTLTVAFKEAGLGDELQVHVVLTADAACVNPGSNKPQASNKQDTLAEGDFPVQNGRAEGELSGTATFDPSSPCPDPMTISYSNVTLTDVTNGISVTL
jgi:type II secretory pathway pseudopilin PulG